MPILIDGFNLIYKFPELEGLMYEGKLAEARAGLLDRLKEYARLTGAKVRVVFDGKKQPSLLIKSESAGVIDVYYSLDFSADHLIKEFIKKDINPRMATVVTSDKEIIAYVTRFKAKVKTSEEFAKMVDEIIEASRAAALPEKEDDPAVSQEDVSYWERLFKGKKRETPRR